MASPGGYSHVAKAGDTVYIAGQIALDTEGNLVGKGDTEAQTHQAYANLQAILEELGGSLEDIVKLTIYLLDVDDFVSIRKYRVEYLGEGKCAATAVLVSALADPAMVIEVDVMAAKA